VTVTDIREWRRTKRRLEIQQGIPPGECPKYFVPCSCNVEKTRGRNELPRGVCAILYAEIMDDFQQRLRDLEQEGAKAKR
jgi:hypothetical protein